MLEYTVVLAWTRSSKYPEHEDEAETRVGHAFLQDCRFDSSGLVFVRCCRVFCMSLGGDGINLKDTPKLYTRSKGPNMMFCGKPCPLL